MSQELTPLPPMADLVRRYRELTPDEWEQEFRRSLAMQARGLFQTAALIRAREEGGHDMAELKARHGEFFDLVRKIAYGQILPEVVAYAGQDYDLLCRVGSLPHPDQRRLAAGGLVAVAEPGPDGRFTDRQKDPRRMGRAERRLVFGAGSVRGVPDQITVLSGRRTRKQLRARPTEIGVMSLDYERKCVTVGNRVISFADLSTAVTLLRRG